MITVTSVGNVLLVLAAVPAVASALIYGFGVTWWRSRWGRHLVAYMGSLALVLSLGCLRLVVGGSPLLAGDSLGFACTRVAALALVVIAQWWRLLVVVQAYYEGSPDDGKPLHPVAALKDPGEKP